MALTCNVVSPERPLFEGEATRVVVPGAQGELGIYPRHAPLVARLGVGVARLHAADGTVDRFAVRGGFVKVLHDDITLLVTQAVRPEDIDRAQAEADLLAVKEALRAPKSDAEYDELRTRRKWAEVCLAITAPAGLSL